LDFVLDLGVISDIRKPAAEGGSLGVDGVEDLGDDCFLGSLFLLSGVEAPDPPGI
jgi:hypothetical protein